MASAPGSPGREHDGAVAHHAVRLADRKVAGVRVAHHAPPCGAERTGGHHGRHHRRFAARACREVGHASRRRRGHGPDAVRVEAGDRFERPAIGRDRVLPGRVVGQVGTGDDQRPATRQQAAERSAEPADHVGVVAGHDRRHDRRRRKQALRERDLHLERVFTGVHRRVGHAVRVFFDQRGRERLVHFRDAERRPEAAAREDADAAESGAGVVRAEDHDGVVLVRGRLAPRVGGDLSGVHVAGVRRDDRDGRLAPRRHGVLEDRVERRVQRASVGGVELAGHRRLAHALAAPSGGTDIAAARRCQQEQRQEPSRCPASPSGEPRRSPPLR